MCASGAGHSCNQEWRGLTVSLPRAAKGEQPATYQGPPAGESTTPKIFHAIWLGSEPGAEILKSLATLQRLNPGWTVRLWRDDELDWLENRDLFDRAATFQGKSNLARYEILYRWGGYYIDCDFEWLRPLDARTFSLHHLTAAQEGHDRYNQAIIGAPRGHPFIRRLIDDVRESIQSRENPYSVEVSGPVFFSLQIRSWLAEGNRDFRPIPRDTVYPYFVDKLYQRGQGPWSPHVVAVHHWQQGRDWQQALWARKLVHDAYKRFDVRGKYRWLKGALAARNQGRDVVDPIVAAVGWLVQGSDTYVDTAATADRVILAAYSQALHGRVLAYTATALELPAELREERIPSVSLAGPGEVIETHTDGGPVRVDEQLDYLSHIRLLALTNPSMCAEELEGALRMATSGRVDFVLVTPPADADASTRRAVSTTVDAFKAAGARVAALSPNGRLRYVSGEFQPDLHAFTGQAVVIDSRPIRRRKIRLRNG